MNKVTRAQDAQTQQAEALERIANALERLANKYAPAGTVKPLTPAREEHANGTT